MALTVSYYTMDTPYANEAKEWAASAIEHLRSQWMTIPVDSMGSWQANTQMKAVLLENVRAHFRGPILYTDIDARFRSDPWPYLETLKKDVGVHTFHGELLSGTIFLQDTQFVKDLLRSWVVLCGIHPKKWDQCCLHAALDKLTWGSYSSQKKQLHVNVDNLPAEYCFIFDTMREQSPNAVPVIEHFQASRRYKNVI